MEKMQAVPRGARDNLIRLADTRCFEGLFGDAAALAAGQQCAVGRHRRQDLHTQQAGPTQGRITGFGLGEVVGDDVAAAPRRGCTTGSQR